MSIDHALTTKDVAKLADALHTAWVNGRKFRYRPGEYGPWSLPQVFAAANASWEMFIRQNPSQLRNPHWIRKCGEMEGCQ